jgi:hypothetical protein
VVAVQSFAAGDELVFLSGDYRFNATIEINANGTLRAADNAMPTFWALNTTVGDIHSPIFSLKASVQLVGLSFRGTSSGSLVGVSVSQGYSIFAKNCSFEDFQPLAAPEGVAVMVLSQEAHFENCMFARNVAIGSSVSGGAISITPACDSNAIYTFTDCLFIGALRLIKSGPLES